MAIKTSSFRYGLRGTVPWTRSYALCVSPTCRGERLFVSSISRRDPPGADGHIGGGGPDRRAKPGPSGFQRGSVGRFRLRHCRSAPVGALGLAASGCGWLEAGGARSNLPSAPQGWRMALTGVGFAYRPKFFSGLDLWVLRRVWSGAVRLKVSINFTSLA